MIVAARFQVAPTAVRIILAAPNTVVAFVRQRLPAQAGIHAERALPNSSLSMGSRLRGNDDGFGVNGIFPAIAPTSLSMGSRLRGNDDGFGVNGIFPAIAPTSLSMGSRLLN
jgi:hypothetical protein